MRWTRWTRWARSRGLYLRRANYSPSVIAVVRRIRRLREGKRLMSNLIQSEKKELLQTQSKWRNVDCLFSHYRIAGALFTLLAIASVIWSGSELPGSEVRKWLAAVWCLSPPIWFFFEFHWARATKTTDQLKCVKESQDLAAKIWAGVVTALSVLYLK